MKKKKLKHLSLKKRIISSLNGSSVSNTENAKGGTLSLCATLFSFVIICEVPNTDNECGGGSIPEWSQDNCN